MPTPQQIELARAAAEAIIARPFPSDDREAWQATAAEIQVIILSHCFPPEQQAPTPRSQEHPWEPRRKIAANVSQMRDALYSAAVLLHGQYHSPETYRFADCPHVGCREYRTLLTGGYLEARKGLEDEIHELRDALQDKQEQQVTPCTSECWARAGNGDSHDGCGCHHHAKEQQAPVCVKCGDKDSRDSLGKCTTVRRDPGGSLVYCSCKCEFPQVPPSQEGGEQEQKNSGKDAVPGKDAVEGSKDNLAVDAENLTLETVLWAAANFIACAPDLRPPEQREVVLKGLEWAMEAFADSSPPDAWQASLEGIKFDLDLWSRSPTTSASIVNARYKSACDHLRFLLIALGLPLPAPPSPKTVDRD